MAVPAGSIRDTLSILDLDSQNHVLENLVDRMAGVQRSIGVRRTIVEDKGFVLRRLRGLPAIKVICTTEEMLSLELGIRTSPAETRG
jgi:hypothetical protein